MSAVGCAPDSLEENADQVTQLRKHIFGFYHDLNWQLQDLTWNGVDAEDLTNTWRTATEPQFDEVCALLEQLERTLRYNASNQRQASSQCLKALYWFANSLFQRIYGSDGNGLSPIDLQDPTSTRGANQLPKKNFYGTPVFSPGGPSRADVNQGALGDCYLMAAMSSLASTPEGRRKLQEMIHDNGDGTYTVTFGDGSSETVDGDLFMGRDRQSPAFAGFGAGGAALWPMILEKAYAQKHGGSFPEIEEGNSAETLAELGGSETKKLNLQSGTSRRDVIRTIDSATAQGRALVASGGGHAWTIVATDGKTVELYNPWGDNLGWDDNDTFWKGLGIDEHAFNSMNRPGGRLMVPIDHFIEHWNYVGYETARH